MAPSKTTAQRFLEKVEREPGGCHVWTAYVRPSGYGMFGIGRRVHYAHRVAYELFVGPIPEGLQIDHLCRNRRCVNPMHLEPVTHRENGRRGKWSRKTHCVHGHAYTPDNTYYSADGSRRCRICTSASNRASFRRRK